MKGIKDDINISLFHHFHTWMQQQHSKQKDTRKKKRRTKLLHMEIPPQLSATLTYTATDI